MSDSLRIGELVGGGLVLSYRCDARCRHCLNACGPHRTDGQGTGEEAPEAILDQLAERGPRARYFIGGGEPFLQLARLRATVAGMRRRGLQLDYVETSASWAVDDAHAVEVLTGLAEVGLDQVMVSLSPFHAEHIPVLKPTSVINASRVLPRGALISLPSFISDLQDHPLDRPLELERILSQAGDGYALAIAERYSTVPAGRAGRYLWRHGTRVPWRELLDRAPCRRELVDTGRFQIDADGRYQPSNCAGIALPLAEVPGEIDLERYPVLKALWLGGLGALVELARGAGFSPFESYSSACDLCTHARFSLAPRGYAELAPAGFYHPLSIPEFSAR